MPWSACHHCPHTEFIFKITRRRFRVKISQEIKFYYFDFFSEINLVSNMFQVSIFKWSFSSWKAQMIGNKFWMEKKNKKTTLTQCRLTYFTSKNRIQIIFKHSKILTKVDSFLGHKSNLKMLKHWNHTDCTLSNNEIKLKIKTICF